LAEQQRNSPRTAQQGGLEGDVSLRPLIEVLEEADDGRLPELASTFDQEAEES
jgi:hypothetical protein